MKKYGFIFFMFLGCSNGPLYFNKNKVVPELLDADINKLNEEELNELLMKIIVDGYSEEKKEQEIVYVNKILKKGANVNYNNPYGRSMLMLAVEEGKKHVIEILIKKGADVNARSKEGWTSLVYSSYKGFSSITEILIEEGADVNTKDNKGMTAAMWAVKFGNIDILRILLEKNSRIDAEDNDGHTSLYWAIVSKQTEAAILLLDSGAGINMEIKDNEGTYSPLNYAAKTNQSTIIEPILKRDGLICIDAIDKYSKTALMYAAENGSFECLEELIKLGANVNAADIMGYTTLYYANHSKHKKCAMCLIDNGAKKQNNIKVKRCFAKYKETVLLQFD